MAINKHVDDSKKVTRAEERIFSDLATIKAPQDSSITVANKNWHIVVDQYTGYKESEFYGTKSDFMESTCNKFNEWKNNGKPVTNIINAWENKVLIKIANYPHWKLGITAEYSEKAHLHKINLLHWDSQILQASLELWWYKLTHWRKSCKSCEGMFHL